jgi:hypothetical protein
METVQSIIDFAAKLRGVQAAAGSRPPPALKRDILSNYFQAMHVPLMRGRLFLHSEDFFSDVAVVNDAFVRAYFGGLSRLGASFAGGASTRTSASGSLGTQSTRCWTQHRPLSTFRPCSA